MSENELATEKLRQRLVRECPEFNTVDAFRLLDLQGNGEVNKEELISCLEGDVGAVFTDSEFDLFKLHFFSWSWSYPHLKLTH